MLYDTWYLGASYAFGRTTCTMQCPIVINLMKENNTSTVLNNIEKKVCVVMPKLAELIVCLYLFFKNKKKGKKECINVTQDVNANCTKFTSTC